MSGIAWKVWARRSIPKPKAKPLCSSGSMPTALKTFGWTIPQPPSSIQPVWLHVRHPSPRQIGHVISYSADGSVNGKLPAAAGT